MRDASSPITWSEVDGAESAAATDQRDALDDGLVVIDEDVDVELPIDDATAGEAVNTPQDGPGIDAEITPWPDHSTMDAAVNSIASEGDSAREMSDGGQAPGAQDTGTDAGTSDASDASDCAVDRGVAAWRGLQSSNVFDTDACQPTTPNCVLETCAVCSDGGASSAGCDACRANAPWPNRLVPVCFTAATAANPDFGAIVQMMRDGVHSTWAAVADVEFTGWEACPTTATGIVQLDVEPNLAAGAYALGYQGPGATYAPVLFGLSRGDFSAGLIPHEIGHILGFSHLMSRPQVTVSSSQCSAPDDSGVLDASATVDSESVMLETNDCRSRPLLSRWDIVNVRSKYGPRADNVVSTGVALYARQRTTGDIYVRNRSSWSKISGPVGQLVAVGTKLHALTPDLSAILQYSGSDAVWTKVGYEALELVACGTDLCAVLPNGDFARYRLGTWTTLGGPATMYAATATDIYRLTLGRYNVERYSESDDRWYQVGGIAGMLYATSTALFATYPYNGGLHLYSGAGMTWSDASLSVRRHYIGAANALYALSLDRSQIWRYSGSADTWTAVGGRADWLYGGPDALYMTEPATKDILRYDGQGWERIGQP